jgi:CDP-diglyceride synthetase
LFLEVFGHIYISLLSALGYKIYTMHENYMIMLFVFTFVSDQARKNIGMAYGSKKYATYLAPNMTVEGAILGTIAPMVVAFILFHI